MARFRLAGWFLLLGALGTLAPAFNAPASAFGGRCKQQVCIQYVYVPVEKVVYRDRDRDDERKGGRLHILFLGATAEPSVGPRISAAHTRIDDFHRRLPPGRRGEFEPVFGDKLTKEESLRRLDGLLQKPRAQVDPEKDTLLVYFNGHGAAAEVATQVQKLKMHSGDAVTRTELSKALESSKFRLTLLVTDSCFGAPDEFGTNNLADKPPKVVTPPKVPTLDPLVDSPYREAVLTDLFFNHTGFLDLNSAAKGQSALAGVFSDSFFDRLEKQLPGEQYAGQIEWREFVPLLRDRVQKQFDFTYAKEEPNLSSDDKKALVGQKLKQTVYLVPDDSGATRVPRFAREKEQVAAGGSAPGAPAPAPALLGGAPPARPPEPRVANITVHVPEGAALALDGTPTKQTATTRYFQSPPLGAGESATYTFRAEVSLGGKTTAEAKEVTVRPGEEAVVTLLGGRPAGAP